MTTDQSDIMDSSFDYDGEEDFDEYQEWLSRQDEEEA